MELIIVGGLFALFIIVGIAFTLKKERKNTTAMTEFAQKHGHTLQEAGRFGYPSVRGVHQGYTFEIVSGVEGEDDDEYYTTFRLCFPQALPTRFRITASKPQGMFSPAPEGRRILMGSPEFDRTFRTEGRLAESVRGLFANPASLNVVASFLNAYPDLSELTHEHLYFKLYTLPATCEELERHLHFTTQMARELDHRIDRNIYAASPVP